jgi:hypothetical protein
MEGASDDLMNFCVVRSFSAMICAFSFFSSLNLRICPLGQWGSFSASYLGMPMQGEMYQLSSFSYPACKESRDTR